MPLRQAHPDAAQTLWRAYLGPLGLQPDAALLADAVVIALAQRAVVYDRRFRHWEGTVPGVRPRYVPYSLGLLRHWTEQVGGS